LFVLALTVASCGGGTSSSTTPTTPTPPPSSPGLACGTERWLVKTLADSAASSVNLNAVTPTTIRDLNRFATHCTGLPETRTLAEEFRVFEVTGRITFFAHEDDRDYHIALEDPSDPAFMGWRNSRTRSARGRPARRISVLSLALRRCSARSSPIVQPPVLSARQCV
jgi:hypothetical protein